MTATAPQQPPPGGGASAWRGGGTIGTRIVQRVGRRIVLLLPLVWLLGSLTLGVPAGAQHAETPETAAAEHGAAAAKSPSIMNVEPGLMVWTIVTFVVLLVALRFTAWKPLMASLEARERRIREAVEGAERARRDSEAAVAQQRELLDRAKAEAHAIIEEGKADGARLREALSAQARVEAEEFKTRAKRELELATEAAKQELFVHATKLSVELAEKILQRSLDSQDQRRIVERVVEEYRNQQAH